MPTRQWELFGRSLGQGVPRRTLLIAVIVAAVWWAVLLAVGVGLTHAVSPALYLVPPFATTWAATWAGEDGRMALLRWYDAVLARVPGRRRPVRNPLLRAAARRACLLVVRLDAVVLRDR